MFQMVDVSFFDVVNDSKSRKKNKPEEKRLKEFVHICLYYQTVASFFP